MASKKGQEDTGRERQEDHGAQETSDVIAMTISEDTKARSACASCGKRRALEGCTQLSCIQCCKDSDCEMHKKGKQQKAWKERVLAGTTEYQLFAAKKRRSRVAMHKREKAFRHTGDSIVLWDLRTFMRNPSWKKEALRRSRRNAASKIDNSSSRRSFSRHRRDYFAR